MTLAEFKAKIAQKYETNVENIILGIGDKEYSKETSKKQDESKLSLFNDLSINEKTVVKLTFVEKESVKSRDASQNARAKSKSAYSSSVVVTTCINNFGETHQNGSNFDPRSRGQTQYNQEETEVAVIVQPTNALQQFNMMNLYSKY